MNITITENVSSTSSVPNTPIGPLASLYNNKYATQSYAYPRDLNSSYKGHAIKFDFMETYGKGWTGALTEAAGVAAVMAAPAAGAAAGAVVGATVGGVAGTKGMVVGGVVGAAAGGAAATYSISKTTEFTQAMQGTTTGISIKPPVTNTQASVTLYMPETLEFTYDANYNDLSLGDVAADSALSGLGGRAITSVLNDNMAKLALNKAGYVFNPQQQLLFNGIDFRTYSMSFTFTPYSQNEANEVKKIIQLFRQYAAPKVVTEAAGFFFNPPGMVDVTYLFNNNVNQNLHKLKRSVIESVTVNYAPNGWAAMEDGMPTQTTLTLGFKEVELVDRVSIMKGY